MNQLYQLKVSYLYGRHYPDKVNLKEGIQVLYHEALASAKAIAVYHSMNLSGEIGIIFKLNADLSS